MVNFKNILVPIDFSEGSSLALDYAASFGFDFGSQLHLLCIVEEESLSANIGGDPLDTKESWRKQNLKRLEEFIPAKYRDLDILKRVDGGLSYQAIIDYATKNKIDLIIMGSNGQTGFIESWLGGTSYEVARKAPCAVMTVKPECKVFVED